MPELVVKTLGIIMNEKRTDKVTQPSLGAICGTKHMNEVNIENDF